MGGEAHVLTEATTSSQVLELQPLPAPHASAVDKAGLKSSVNASTPRGLIEKATGDLHSLPSLPQAKSVSPTAPSTTPRYLHHEYSTSKQHKSSCTLMFPN